MTTLMSRHGTSDMANHASRAAMRRQRLMEIENEMRLEEAEALKMTEEQRQILFRSFTSVKVEFSDLDGLARNASPQIPHACAPSSPIPTVQVDHAFVILTNADLANFAPHETIRASAGSRPRPLSRVSSPDLSARARPFNSSSPSLKHSHSSLAFTPSSYLSSPAANIKAIISRKNLRSRSPIKGVFSAGDAYDSDSERTVRGSDSDDDSSPRPRKERKKSRVGRGHAASGPGQIVSPNPGSRPRTRSGPGPVRHVSNPATSQSRRDASRAADLKCAAGSHRDAVPSSPLMGVQTRAGSGSEETLSASSRPPRPYPAYITYSPTTVSSTVAATFPSSCSANSNSPSANIPRSPTSLPAGAGAGMKANDGYQPLGRA